MPAVERKLAEIDPAENRNRRITLMSLHERIVGESRRGLLVLFGAVGLVLLVACTNFANLLLARGAEREQEVVVRAALGARRGRIIRELLTESVIIAILGGAVGVALAIWGLDLLKLLGPQDLPRLDGVSLDFSVLGFTFLISLLTGVVFGLAPAWHASRADITGALKESGRSHTAGASRQRVRNLLVVAEIAIALVLLAGAGLLVRSLLELRDVAPGFDPTRTLSMRIELPEIAIFRDSGAGAVSSKHPRGGQLCSGVASSTRQRSSNEWQRPSSQLRYRRKTTSDARRRAIALLEKRDGGLFQDDGNSYRRRARSDAR